VARRFCLPVKRVSAVEATIETANFKKTQEDQGVGMANIKSAEKRARQTAVRNARNRSQRSQMRGAVKNLRAAVDAGDKAKAEELLGSTISLVDTTAQKGVIHRNAAARTKSRLIRAVAKMDS
jgi:small subunit ribosomal protein S20